MLRGRGVDDLVCRCGASVLVEGYLPANLLAIRIACFRCGVVTETPGLPDGEILAPGAVGVEPNAQQQVVATADVPADAVYACGEMMEQYVLTRPGGAPDWVELSTDMLEATASAYDRLTGGHLVQRSTAARFEDDPFAWSVQRLRGRIGTPGWSWLHQNDDALAAMHVAVFWHLVQCWGRHPHLDRLLVPLRTPGRFLRVVTAFAVAKMLFDDGNRIGFSPLTAEESTVDVHFSAPFGEPLSLALCSPDALQWRAREAAGLAVLRAAVIDAMAATQARVNTRHPGLVVLQASILLPRFDQILIEVIDAVLRSYGRRHRGIATVALLVPRVFPVGRPDQVGFGYTFFPVRNPTFRGQQPVVLQTAT